MDTEPDLPTIFARFTDDDILEEMGRLLYSILNIFLVNGYQVKLFDNIDFSKLDKYGQMVSAMDNLSLTATIPDKTSHMIYLFDREDNTDTDHQWRKKIQLKFDIFSPYWFTEPVIMPYPVHPLLSGADLPQRLDKLRQNEKKLRIFFSGDTKGYTRNRITYPNTKLPRLTVINTILEELKDETIHVKNETELNKLFAGDYFNRCVIVDTSNMWIDPEEWLPDLSKTDFFICPPGYCMPMCHNVIEAMAVGTIPVINYPEWFNPTLGHMENCIVFDDQKDLIIQVKAILNMGQQEVAEMRRKVIDYYETHLNPRKFIGEIEARKESRLTALMITDRNTRKNAARLNRNSVLITGKSVIANSRLYKFIRSFKS